MKNPQPTNIVSSNRPRWLTQSPKNLSVVFFDIESTGGNPQNSSIIEIAAVKYVNGKPVDRYECLVNPKRPVPRIVQKITGIDNRMLRKAPSIEEVFPEFMDLVGDSILVSHGALGDIAFVSHYSEKLLGRKLDNYYFCTHLLCTHFFPNIPNKKLSGLGEYFNIPPREDLHRALTDAELTADVFWEMLHSLNKKGYNTVEDILKIQGDQPTLERLGSGISPSQLNDAVPSSPGVFYLFDSNGEISYVSAAESLKKTMSRLTRIGQGHKSFDKILVDIKRFRFERTPSYLAALLKETEEINRLQPHSDPRVVEERGKGFVQILIPDDLVEWMQKNPNSSPFQVETQQFLDDSQTNWHPDTDHPEESYQQEKAKNIHLKTLDLLNPKNKRLRVVRTRKPLKHVTERLKHVRPETEDYIVFNGPLREGVGWHFGPFEQNKWIFKQFKRLAQLLPFHDFNLPKATRAAALKLFISTLFGTTGDDLQAIADELSKSTLFGNMKRRKLIHLFNHLKKIEEIGFTLNEIDLPSTGLSVVTDPGSKTLLLYVVVKGRIKKHIELTFEEYQKLQSTRFFTRLFSEYHDEVVAPQGPTHFTDDVCQELELFSHWLHTQSGEGVWVSFEELRDLYEPEESL